jgi:parvulin-like peptidyl-prolyl isomerase
VGLTLVGNLGLAGCQSAGPPKDRLQPDLPALLNLPAGDPGQARGQKEERTARRPAGSLLNLGPEAAGGGDRCIARIRAVVNGEPILDEEVLAASYQGLREANTEAEKARVLQAKLDELIDREVVLQDAFARLAGRGERFLDELKKAAGKEFEKTWLQRMMRGNNFTNLDEFKSFLRNNGMPLDIVRRSWERQFMAMEYLRHRIDPHIKKIGHLDIAEYYDRHPEEFRVADSIHWQDIFIAATRHPSREAARQFAEVLVARIRKGEDFVRLAKEHDNGDSSLRQNAEGIGRKRGEIQPPEAEGVLFALHDGEVALVELETGYHIVRLIKRQHAGLLPFNDDKVQKDILNRLRNQVFGREMKRIVLELRRKAVIEIAQEGK